MAKRIKLTDGEILRALEESSEDEVEIEDNSEEMIENDLSGSETDVLETASETSDEMFISEDSEESDNENQYISYIGKDGTEWNSVPYIKGRTAAHNIIRGGINKVVLPPGKHIDCSLDAFSLFFNDNIINIIVKFTNLHGRTVLGKNWKETDQMEILAYIGLLIDAGLKKQGLFDYDEFWDPLFGCTIYRACMSKNRFAALSRHLRFDDLLSRSARRDQDRFAPIRDIWDLVNKNLRKYYIPGENLTIDEQLVPFRGRVKFRQYMPSKPDKYGMKIWWICDSKTSYPLFGIPYLGQEQAGRAVNLARTIVEQLCEPFERTNRNITFDNYFTSYELANSLLSKGLTCVGTSRKNKRCIPQNFLPHRTREVESNVFGFRRTMTLVSYVPKKNRAVVLLSTMHHTSEVDNTNKNKSEINLYYNSTKGGVDTLDQKCHAFSVKRKTRRWPIAQFYNLVDVCGVAAEIIWKNLYPDWNKTKMNSRRKIFLKNLVQELVIPNIKRRSVKHLPKSTIATINETLENSSNIVVIDKSVPETNIRRRCYLCPSAKGRASKQCCGNCGKNVCNEHSQKIVVCKTCLNK